MPYTHAQLPSMLNRRAAELSGAVTYVGASCSFCANVHRYTSSAKCVRCAKLSARLQWALRKALLRQEC